LYEDGSAVAHAGHTHKGVRDEDEHGRSAAADAFRHVRDVVVHLVRPANNIQHTYSAHTHMNIIYIYIYDHIHADKHITTHMSKHNNTMLSNSCVLKRAQVQ
jgi:hypothetical protein